MTYSNKRVAAIADMSEQQAARILRYRRNNMAGVCQFSVSRKTLDEPFQEDTELVRAQEKLEELEQALQEEQHV